MNVRWYRFRNFFHMAKDRLKHPPPVYKKIGGMSAIVNRADGREEKLKNISFTYAKRWGVEAGPPPTQEIIVDEAESDG